MNDTTYSGDLQWDAEKQQVSIVPSAYGRFVFGDGLVPAVPQLAEICKGLKLRELGYGEEARVGSTIVYVDDSDQTIAEQLKTATVKDFFGDGGIYDFVEGGWCFDSDVLGVLEAL